MALISLDLSKLSEKLKENIADYSKIFLLKQSNGFKIKNDRLFTGFQVRDKIPLIRGFSDPMVQPGRTGSVNFKGGVGLSNRWATLMPFKADLKLTEVQIYAWSKTYLAKRQPNDPTDIYSFAAMSWYMEQVMTQIGKDVHGTIYKGVHNPTGTSHIDITDGLDLLFDQGYATTGAGAVGDIPADNMVTAAATINQSNIVTEINNLVVRIFETLDEPLDEDGVIALDPMLYLHLINALDGMGANQQYLTRVNGVIRPSVLPNFTVEPRSWLKGSQKIFGTVVGNLAVLGPEETTEDVPSIKVEEAERNLKIFIDGEFGINYCDGRLLFLNSK